MRSDGRGSIAIRITNETPILVKRRWFETQLFVLVRFDGRILPIIILVQPTDPRRHFLG